MRSESNCDYTFQWQENPYASVPFFIYACIESDQFFFTFVRSINKIGISKYKNPIYINNNLPVTKSLFNHVK